ncbi:Phage gp6-like head-tail connector protein, partial [Dysosmobacter welbionis]
VKAVLQDANGGHRAEPHGVGLHDGAVPGDLHQSARHGRPVQQVHLLLGVSLDSQVFHTEEVQGVHSSGPAVRPGQHRSRIIAVPHSHQPEGL